jgi:hypothetical protein
VPVLQYFLVVGSVLTGLIFYANKVIAPVSLPFSVSQRMGLPETSKVPVVFNRAPDPEIVLTSVGPTVEAKASAKLIGKRKPTRVVREVKPQGHYAAYPPHVYGSIW